MTSCYLGLGSNLHSPKRQLHRAMQSLRKLPRTSYIKQSKIYMSRPLGVRAQPHYLNMVVQLNTSLSPHCLLNYCHKIEQKQLRTHKAHWGARTIDIDILLFGSKTMHTRQLHIPHLQMLKRDFVLVPLLEIAPQVQLPNGQRVSHYLTSCEHYIDKII